MQCVVFVAGKGSSSSSKARSASATNVLLRNATSLPDNMERQEDQGCRLRSAVARKTESQAHLLHPGRPVPQLLRERGQGQGCYRREAARATRAAFGQCCLPARLRHFPPPGAPVGASRACAGEWKESEHSFVRSHRG